MEVTPKTGSVVNRWKNRALNVYSLLLGLSLVLSFSGILLRHLLA